MVYGVIWGEDNPEVLCNKIYRNNSTRRLLDDAFLSCFKYIDEKIETKYSELFKLYLTNDTSFSIESEFDLGKIKERLFSQRDRNQLADLLCSTEKERVKNIKYIYAEYFNRFRSLLLAIFCSAFNADKILFITGDIDFSTGKAIAVTDIDKKFEIVCSKINDCKFDRAECEFICIADKDDKHFKKINSESNIAIQRFNPDTALSEIVYYIQHSSIVLEKDKHIYTNLFVNELKECSKKTQLLTKIDFYFSGDKSSSLLFDTRIFEEVNTIIKETPRKEFSINFHTLEYYASQQRMDGQKEIPSWINNKKFKTENGEYDFTEINKINGGLSIFARNLEPQLGMLIDSILKNNSNVKLNHFEVDNKQFFNEEYKKRSSIIVSYADGSSWMCYSEFSEEQMSGKICITKLKKDGQNSINDIVSQIAKVFQNGLRNRNYDLSNNFTPWVLIGFPGTGKTETTRFFSRLENINNTDLEIEKIFSSDDRINNRAYSDNDESKLLRSKFDWAYPSRKEAKDRIENLVDKKFKDKKSNIDELKLLLNDIYNDNDTSRKIANSDKDTLVKLLNAYYTNGYREIEYSVRTSQVIDSIDLAWNQQQRLDLGAKEILEPAVRRRLFLRGYKIILLINAERPFTENDFALIKNEIPEIKENTWNCIKDNLALIEASNNDDIFKKMSDHAFNEYFKDVYGDHPEIAAEGPRRNIFDYKNDSLGGKCKSCKKAACNNRCEFWTEESKEKLANILKKEIWDKRFRYYLEYCQYVVVRNSTIEKTATAINNIDKDSVLSSEYGRHIITDEKLPEPFNNNEKGSFAAYTVSERFQEIWEKEFCSIKWNDFIKTHKVSDFLKRTGISLKNYLMDFYDATLQEFFYKAEFLKSEFFLYHIILEQWKTEHKDLQKLFSERKNEEWQNEKDVELIPKLKKLIFQTSSLDKNKLAEYLYFMTTGNAHDLSQNTNYNPKKDIHLIYNSISPIRKLLKTYAKNYKNSRYKNSYKIYNEVYDFLIKRKYSRFDLIPDNAGVELFSDYLFALYLLQTNTVQRIVLHLKPYPMFVSDATKCDFDILKDIINKEYPEINIMLTQYEKEGRLEIQRREKEFFYEPYFKDCKFIEKIMKAGCELLIVKGDLNYRRLVGDLHWNWTQPIKPIIAPFITCRCLCLRCIKSDVLLGLTEQEADKVKEIPKEELPKGKYATIQFI